MADAGLLKVDNREIEILDPARMRERARVTRRPAEATAAGAPPRVLRAVPALAVATAERQAA